MRLHSGEDVSYLMEHPIIQRHIDLIERFANDRIFTIFYEDYDNQGKKLIIEECCDNWFNRTLTIEDCKELAELFTDIANELENNKSK